MTTATGQKPRQPCGEASIAPSLPKTRPRAEAYGKKGDSYRPLEVHFQRDGFDYRQITREGNFAIYEQTWSGCSDPSVCYEVIRIRSRHGFQIGERFVEPAEVYPNSEAWGVEGFTFTDRDAAFAKRRETSLAITLSPTDANP